MEVKKSKVNSIPSHPTFVSMVADAALNLKYPHTSRPAIKKYILSNYKLSDRASSLLNNAIKKGVQMGYFTQPKGPSGPIKLDKVKAKSLLAPPKPLGSAYNKKITAKKHKTISKPSKKSQNKSKPVLTSSLKTKKHSLKPSASHPSKAPSHATSMKKTTSSKAVSAQKKQKGTLSSTKKTASKKQQASPKKLSAHAKPVKKASTAAKLALLAKKSHKSASGTKGFSSAH